MCEPCCKKLALYLSSALDFCNDQRKVACFGTIARKWKYENIEKSTIWYILTHPIMDNLIHTDSPYNGHPSACGERVESVGLVSVIL